MFVENNLGWSGDWLGGVVWLVGDDDVEVFCVFLVSVGSGSSEGFEFWFNNFVSSVFYFWEVYFVGNNIGIFDVGDWISGLCDCCGNVFRVFGVEVDWLLNSCVWINFFFLFWWNFWEVVCEVEGCVWIISVVDDGDWCGG